MKRETVFFLMWALLVSCLFSTSNLTSTGKPIIVASHSVVSTSGYENVTTHVGDLNVEGTETFVIENCTYMQKGNVVAKEYARLIIRNAELVFNVSANNEFSVEIRDRAQFLSSGSDFKSARDVRIGFADFSWGNLTDIRFLSLDPSSGSLFTVAVESDATLVVQNCYLDGTLDGFSGSTKVYDSCVERIEVLGGEMVISDSEIFSWIGLRVTGFSDVEVENFLGYNRGYAFTINYFNSFENLTFTGVLEAGNLTISNSRVKWGGMGFMFYGESRGKIRRSILAFVYSSENAVVEIRDSTVFYISDFVNPGSTMSIWNSTIGMLDCASMSGSTFFSSCNLTEINTFHSSGYVCGNITFKAYACYPQAILVGVGWWTDGRVTRNFNVICIDESGNPLRDVSLILGNEDENSTWQGYSDVNGCANMDIIFSDVNYTVTVRLRASKDSYYNETKNLELLADTPISVVLAEKLASDLDENRKVDIIDITTVAAAYGSKSGNQNWNALADLDRNGTINIVDVTLVAKDYGKTG